MVALVCALAGVALVALLGGAAHGGGTVASGTARAGGAAPGTASLGASSLQPERLARAGHGLGVPGMSERQLRRFETAVLGSEHAREHAMIRAALRRRDEVAAELGPSRPVARTAASPRQAGPPRQTGPPEEVGSWETDKTVFPIVAIHAALLPTGKVLIFSYPISPVRENYGRAFLWDPADGSLTEKPPPDLDGHPANIWCAGQTFTADGELVVFGGNLDFPVDGDPATTWKGLDRVYTFNPFTETWREQPKMEHGRWYPSGIRMADGRIPILNGQDESGLKDPGVHINKDIEVFTPPASIGGLGTTRKIGSVGGAGNPPVGDLYPRMFYMPDGKVMIAGPDPWPWAFTSIGANGFTWMDMPDMSRFRVWGTTVLVPGDAAGSTRLLALGGTDYSGAFAGASSETFDESNPAAGWRAAPSSVYGRGHANTVLLPDGSMVEVGGGVGANNASSAPLFYAEPETKQIELWDKSTGKWTLGPAQTEARAYHSTALLLPDGRVMSAGDEYNGDGVNVDTAEFYEPPYLHKGPRPRISSVSGQIQTRAGFGVGTPDANITGAALVAPGAVTHGVDMNQRVIQLAANRGTGCVSLRAPSANVAPPGWYMLFLLNAQGVPSVAKFVKLQASAGPAQCDAPIPPEPAPKTTTPPPKSTPTAPADRKPTLRRLTLSSKRFRRGRSLTIGYRLDEAAKVTVSFERRKPGRRVRYARVKGKLTVKGKTGANRLTFRGRLGKRWLAPGTYRLTLVARDADGDRSKPLRATFRFLKRHP
jgi:hypothetical protein